MSGKLDLTAPRKINIQASATGLALGSGGMRAYTLIDLQLPQPRLAIVPLDGSAQAKHYLAADFVATALDSVVSTAPDLVAVVGQGGTAATPQLRLIDRAIA